MLAGPCVIVIDSLWLARLMPKSKDVHTILNRFVHDIKGNTHRYVCSCANVLIHSKLI